MSSSLNIAVNTFAGKIAEHILVKPETNLCIVVVAVGISIVVVDFG